MRIRFQYRHSVIMIMRSSDGDLHPFHCSSRTRTLMNRLLSPQLWRTGSGRHSSGKLCGEMDLSRSALPHPRSMGRAIFQKKPLRWTSAGQVCVSEAGPSDARPAAQQYRQWERLDNGRGHGKSTVTETLASAYHAVDTVTVREGDYVGLAVTLLIGEARVGETPTAELSCETTPASTGTDTTHPQEDVVMMGPHMAQDGEPAESVDSEEMDIRARSPIRVRRRRPAWRDSCAWTLCGSPRQPLHALPGW